MSVLILVLFIGLFVFDALQPAAAQSGIVMPLAGPMGDLALSCWVLLPKLVIALLHFLLVRRTLSALNRSAEAAALRRFEKRSHWLRQLLTISYLADLFCFGALLRIRKLLGSGDEHSNWIIIDELLVMLPTLLTTLCLWLTYYPLDTKLREATFLSRLERGLPVQICSRPQFLLSNLRHQWALIGVPMLLLMAWSETVGHFMGTRYSEATRACVLLGGSLTVFLFTPLIIRHIWDTAPLPPGDLRDRLLAMCRQYRVGVRELLLWRTFGGMINGAVMGIIKPLRYILLTDALLESMPAKQVEAVMAHELAHVRKHHMFWLLLVAAASMELLRRVLELSLAGLFSLSTSTSLASIFPASFIDVMKHPDSSILFALIASFGGWYFIFGWVSRRFERQADTFAVQHLAAVWHSENPTGLSESQARSQPMGPLPSPADMVAALERGEAIPGLSVPPSSTPTPPDRIPQYATDTMAGALQSVADLNYIPTQRKSWRHGSIAWRQNYLHSLAGQPIHVTSIDEEVRRIKWAGIVFLLAAIALNAWM